MGHHSKEIFIASNSNTNTGSLSNFTCTYKNTDYSASYYVSLRAQAASDHFKTVEIEAFTQI